MPLLLSSFFDVKNDARTDANEPRVREVFAQSPLQLQREICQANIPTVQVSMSFVSTSSLCYFD